MPITAPEVLPEPINPPRVQPAASVETFGGGQGLAQENQEAQRIAQSTGEIATFEKIRADQAATEEAYGGKFAPFVTQALYDPQNGAIANIGKATSLDQIHAITDDTMKRIKEFGNKTSSGLIGAEQAGPFNKSVISSADSVYKTLMAHGDQKFKELDNQNFKSSIYNITAQDSLNWAQHKLDPAYLPQQMSKLQDGIDKFSFRNGYTPDEKEQLQTKVFSNYHGSMVDRMLSDNQYGAAQKYFDDHKKDITDPDIRSNVEKQLDVIPKQQAALSKQQDQERYDANNRQSAIDLMDGKLTLSENQRRFKNDEIDQSTYRYNEGKLSKPDIYEQAEVSDPAKFNAIRQAQLNKSSTPNEILRMITDGQSDKDLRPDDVQYLKKMVKDMPANPRDKAVEAEANKIRDFGNRYFAETNLLGNATNETKTHSEVEQMISDYYRSADGSKASGAQLKDLRNQVIETAVRKKFPGLPVGKLPDVVIDTRGRVTRLLNPDEPSEAAPRYRITPTESQRPDDE